MSKYKAIAICAVIAIAGSALQSQTGKARHNQPQPQSEDAASTSDPNLTPLQTVQYIDKALDQMRIPEGIDSGTITTWPGYFAIEQSTATLWWVRGMRTGMSEWEIRFSSAQVDELDLNSLVLGVGAGNYETLTMPCKPAPNGSAIENCWQNWVASWDDQASGPGQGKFGSIKVARVVGNESQQVLDGQDDAVSPLKKQILLVSGTDKKLIDVVPAKPSWGMEVYLGAANSDAAQRMLRAVKYLLKKMPAAQKGTDPFGP